MADAGAIWLTLQLAGVTTAILLVLCLPLAWWLARTASPVRPVVEALVALPLVLPPTVIGFYLLLFLSPTAPLGGLWVQMTGQTLTFSFAGLVIGSVIYSLPFAVQPMQAGFAALDQGQLEAARTLGASRFDAFRSIALPQSARSILTAAVLSFVHTLGEFGVVLMIGGNIPGRTQVVSIVVFNHVETLDYAAAHRLSLVLLLGAFVALLAVYALNRTARPRLG